MQFAVALDRVIAAPRSKVYRAWLDPALLARWMGPDDFSVTVATVDERVGGVHQVEMLDSEGRQYTFVSVIEELVPDERIVFKFKFDPEAQETKLTITLGDAEGGGTALRLEHERITMEGTLDTQSVNVGWGQTLAKLQALCESSYQDLHRQGEQR
ncbi:MAG TPA: SRPBCC domain-containing protein [Ilumatobacteraceae bacterium]|nr:SRPBCC domain-containing protein [Ilumatobacteraceae bacterium]